MRRAEWAIRCVIGFLLSVTHAGYGQTDIRALEGLLKGQQKALLNFSGDAVALYKWKGGTLEAESPAVRTFAIFITDSVSQQGNRLELSGKRATLVFDSRQKAFALSIREPMKLEVDLAEATTAVALPELIGSLFFSSVKEAVAGVPRELADRIPFDVGSSKGPKQLGQMIFDGNSWKRLEFGNPRYKPPSVIVAPDPRFTEEARKRHYSGAETVFFRLSETGQKSDFWVGCPLDYGLNGQAIAAVKEFVFRPAILDGKPTVTILGVEVNFNAR